MRHHAAGYGVVGLLLGLGVYTGVLVGCSAQKNETEAKKAPCIGCSVDGKTTPRTADGHPDLSGHWGGDDAASSNKVIVSRAKDGSVLFDYAGADLDENGNPTSSVKATAPTPGHVSFNVGSDKPEDQAPYKPEYFAKAKELGDLYYGAANSSDPVQACKPAGVPRGAFGEMQIVQTPGLIAILYPEGMNDRIIYTDGRAHVAHLDTSFVGDSIGHWEGDTLVVDVAGLNDETWLVGGFSAPKFTNIHSEQEHVIERWSRDGDVLTYQATVEDPVMFTKPWVMKPRHIKHASPDPNNPMFQAPCIPTDFGHIVKPTKSDSYFCNYCNPDKFKNTK